MVETLVSAGDGNSVVTSQVPAGDVSGKVQVEVKLHSRLLAETGVRGPDLGRDIVGRVGPCIEGIVGSADDDGSTS